MMFPVMLQGSWYALERSKLVAATVLLTVSGTLGTMLLFYIENGDFLGTSFFGAVFFVPVFFVLIARVLKIRYNILLDLCAPAECAMLAVMKFQCNLIGCCGGIKISLPKFSFIFPSQIVEMCTAIVLCTVLLTMSRKLQNRGRIYPWYMVLYGIARFVLNLFRKTGFVKALHMPFGNFWALISIVVGVLWLIIVRMKENKK